MIYRLPVRHWPRSCGGAQTVRPEPLHFNRNASRKSPSGLSPFATATGRRPSWRSSKASSGAVAVADLEVRALAAGLLSDRQKITDAKAFKRAKKALGIKSHRVGFGPGAVWFWALPTKPETKVIETAAGLASNTPAPVVYAEHHSRPERGDVLLDLGPGPDDGLGGVPAE